ncbi:hypothetical protein AX279_19740 [Pseudomonas sp. J237]|nr:hypothetical protein AX279_19740 [Pseudomonas sp. J237]
MDSSKRSANTIAESPAATPKPSDKDVDDWTLFELARKNIKARLKDPESATFRDQFIGESGIPCGEVNAKNGFGGFTGYKRFLASGNGLAVVEGDMPPPEFEKAWSELCKR